MAAASRLCIICGEPIAHKRLLAIPWTRQCIDCAKAQEQQMQDIMERTQYEVDAHWPDVEAPKVEPRGSERNDQERSENSPARIIDSLDFLGEDVVK